MLARALLDIQHRYGYLPQAELEFLALRTGLPLYRIQEVSTFFPHFRHSPPPEVSVHVCQSMSCHLRGSDKLLKEAQSLASDQVEVKGVSCLGRCDRAPVAFLSRHGHSGPSFHDHLHTRLGESGRSIKDLVARAQKGEVPPHDLDKAPGTPKPLWSLDPFDPRHQMKLEPYQAIQKIVKKELRGSEVIKALEHADLIGLGGAAARTAKKWQDVRDARGEKRYILCNADESEPGTFKDREILLHCPHLVLEGMLIAAFTLGAEVRPTRGYVYIRHEYTEQIEAVNAAIREAQKIVPEAFAKCPIEVFVSPGLYICGEESALIEAMEGKRAQPRNQPPDIRNNGLFDEPTLVNNVETYAWVPSLVQPMPHEPGQPVPEATETPAGVSPGPNHWYARKPKRFFSLSGDVRKPGVYEMPFQSTLRDLIQDRAGGMAEGKVFFAIAPSGPSGGFLPSTLDANWVRQALDDGIPGLRKRSAPQAARVESFRKSVEGSSVSVLDLPLDVPVFRTLELSLGAGIVVYGAPEGAQGAPPMMIEHALNCLRFFEKESCGKCVPCRLGCQQLSHYAQELAGGKTSLPMAQLEQTVRQLSEVMEITSICGLGRGASTPFLTWLEHFQQQNAPKP